MKVDRLTIALALALSALALGCGGCAERAAEPAAPAAGASAAASAFYASGVSGTGAAIQPSPSLSPSPSPPRSSSPSPSPSYPPSPSTDDHADPLDRMPAMDFLNAREGWVVRSSYMKRSALFATADGGQTWSRTDIPAPFVLGVAMRSASSGWAAALDACSVQANGTTRCGRQELLRTADGGRTWTTAWSIGKSADWSALPGPGVTGALTGEAGYAVVADRLLTTADGGSRWREATFGVKGFKPIRAFFADAKLGWAAGTVTAAGGDAHQGIVLATTDGGLHWKRQLVAEGEEGPMDEAGVKGLQFIDSQHGWALFSDESNLAGALYATEDGGSTWRKLTSMRTGRPITTALRFEDRLHGWIPLNVGAGGPDGGYLETTDGGRSWKQAGTAGASVSDMARFAGNIGYAISSEGAAALLRTTDGGRSWRQVLPEADVLQ